MTLPANLVERLDGIVAKLDRAEEQMKSFNDEWSTWVEREQPWRAEHEIGDGGKRVICIFRVVKPIPLRFSVILGEIVHDIRSALDHLASYLVETHGRQPTPATAWPIAPSSWSWKRTVKRRKVPWQLWRKKRGGPLKGIPQTSDAWTLIYRSQPYIRSNKARDDPLWRVHQLWNTDKHRVINKMPLHAHDVLAGFGFLNPPIASKVLVPPHRPLKDGTKLALFEFDGTRPGVPVKTHLTIEVALGEGERYPGGPIVRDVFEIVRDLYRDAAALPYPPPGGTAR